MVYYIYIIYITYIIHIYNVLGIGLMFYETMLGGSAWVPLTATNNSYAIVTGASSGNILYIYLYIYILYKCICILSYMYIYYV